MAKTLHSAPLNRPGIVVDDLPSEVLDLMLEAFYLNDAATLQAALELAQSLGPDLTAYLEDWDASAAEAGNSAALPL